MKGSFDAEISNYEKTKRRVQGEFCKYDHRSIADKLNLNLDDKYIYIKFFRNTYRIDRVSGRTEIIPEEEGGEYKEADHEEVLTIYDILCYSKPGAVPKGEYTLIQRLSTVQNASSYAGAGAFKQDEEFFDDNMDALEAGCIRLGGIPCGKGDLSYKIPMFKDLCVMVSFWRSDEDFPPQLQIMCDTNTLSFMHYETIWYMAHHLLDLLRRG